MARGRGAFAILNIDEERIPGTVVSVNGRDETFVRGATLTYVGEDEKDVRIHLHDLPDDLGALLGTIVTSELREDEEGVTHFSFWLGSEDDGYLIYTGSGEEI